MFSDLLFHQIRFHSPLLLSPIYKGQLFFLGGGGNLNPRPLCLLLYLFIQVGDFPPVAYRLLDAHAIWHGVTIPLVFSWYRFVIQDARYEVSVGKTF